MSCTDFTLMFFCQIAAGARGGVTRMIVIHGCGEKTDDGLWDVRIYTTTALNALLRG